MPLRIAVRLRLAETIQDSRQQVLPATMASEGKGREEKVEDSVPVGQAELVVVTERVVMEVVPAAPATLREPVLRVQAEELVLQVVLVLELELVEQELAVALPVTALPAQMIQGPRVPPIQNLRRLMQRTIQSICGSEQRPKTSPTLTSPVRLAHGDSVAVTTAKKACEMR